VGASELRGFWEDWAGMFEDFTIKVDAVVDLGKGIVYAVYHMEGRPARSSTGVVTLRAALIYEWVDGMIKRLIVRQDIDEARADAERLAQ
jgi:hypothetical protein